MNRLLPWFRLAIGLMLSVLVGCTLGQPPPSAATPDLSPLQTQIALTATAQAVSAAPSSPTLWPTATNIPSLPTLSPTPLPLPSPTATPSPIPTATPLPCNWAQFIRDVTYPDDTAVTIGTTFTKTWRLKNIGSCPWTTGYRLIFVRGDRLNAPDETPFTTEAISPGQTVDISIELTAPTTPGTYQGFFKLRSPEGEVFGIGDDQAHPFWVRVKVVPPELYSLYDHANEAQWVSGAGVLPFDGDATDPRGFVKPRPGVLLEDGSTPTKVLETHPEWVTDGVISGRYPPLTIYPGARFRARIGFIARADGTCGVGDVQFQVNYRDEGGVLHNLGEWYDTCDGNLIPIDLDLSALAGKTIQLALVVAANGPSAQDWAVWVNPRVAYP